MAGNWKKDETLLCSRRTMIAAVAASAASGCLPRIAGASSAEPQPKRHLVTLSFDDGFKKSSLRTAEIYEKFHLAACFNVIATGHHPDFIAPDPYQAGIPKGDFALWNELQHRGHEIMPHGYKHADKSKLPFEEAKDLIQRCLDTFADELNGFDPRQAVFNFPYNAATPELERWLPTRVRAIRARPKALNPLPHPGLVKLTAFGYGPGNCEEALDRAVKNLLDQESGWLIFNTHGLEDEGWGPIRAVYLERLLERLSATESVEMLPAGQALRRSAPLPAE